MRRVAVAGGLTSVCTLVLSGCADDQNTLAPHSSAARSITTLWWVMFIGSAILVMIVTLLVVLGALKRRGRLDRVESRADSPRARNVVLIAGALAPAVVLTALFIYVLTTVSATAEPSPTDAKMTVDVTGKQWFWAVRYPAQKIETANEIHIPVGVPVRIRAHTDDVIHSFWVPELNRKIDMIPGYDNSVLLEADRAGVYRGQCAEFCGLQHANMAFYVVAQPRAAFDRWVAREQRPVDTTRRRRKGLHAGRLRRLSHDQRPLERHDRPGPDAPRRPHDSRRGNDPEREGLARRLDPRSAAHQAREQDARAARQRPAAPAAPHLSGVARVSTVVGREELEKLESIWVEKPGLKTFLTTVDHKKIGTRYLVTSFAFFIAAGLEALSMRTQLAVPDAGAIGPKAYDELFSMHGVTMIFLFVTPMLNGFGNYMVPLQIGARDMAFPRMNALSYWIYLASGSSSTRASCSARRRTTAGSTTRRLRRRPSPPG